MKTCYSLALASLLCLSFAGRLAAQQVETGVVPPDPPEVSAQVAPKLTPEQMELLQSRIRRIRERQAAIERLRPQTATPGLPLVQGRETQIAAGAAATQLGPPEVFLIPRNIENPRANDPAHASTLAEPAAINDGAFTFSAGNYDHAEYAAPDFGGGMTFFDVPVPAGPSDAPIPCCDNDVVYDKARGLTIWSTLYINASATNGVVRLFVRRSVSTQACSYTIDNAGTANNILMDYPHIGLSNDFLYLATNDIPTAGSQNARIKRFELDAMYDCLVAPFTMFSWPSTTDGQRVWRPVEGATETMYWAHHQNSTTLRVFSWPESDPAPTNVLKALSSSSFADPDCRGGTLNNDWADSLSASIIGFTKHGAVGAGRVSWYWSVSPDASHTQGHMHSAIFNEPGLVLINQPSVYNNSFCIMNPNLTANRRGDLGISLAYGGQAGGGGTAATPAVAMDDDFTSGIGFFQTLYPITPTGTHNRTDARYGDYFTVRPQNPCDLFFFATGYALIGGTGVANVDSRLVDFGRQRDSKCYFGWRNSVRVP